MEEDLHAIVGSIEEGDTNIIDLLIAELLAEGE